ncbi:MAG: phosphatidate cytidylyltransferase [Pontiellaceae bacterium]|nr:phosphatidate cytidylyltransferase [Pontiellaceae bacterium]
MDNKRTIIGLIIGAVIILLLSFVPAGNFFCLPVLLGMCGMGTWEFFGLLKAGGLTASKKWGTSVGLIFVTATWVYMLKSGSGANDTAQAMLWSVLLLAVITVFFRILAYPNMRAGLDNALGTLLGIMYVPFLWSFFVRIFLISGPAQPATTALYLLLCTKLSDAGGYFIGSRFGKTKLSPVISPKKSWEGMAGSVIFCLIVNFAWLYFSGGNLGGFDFGWGDALALALLFPAVGTTGDLVESMFKRAVDVKDSNSMVYGLGGILDMIDSVLFNAPLLYIYIKFVLA